MFQGLQQKMGGVLCEVGRLEPGWEALGAVILSLFGDPSSVHSQKTALSMLRYKLNGKYNLGFCYKSEVIC